MTMRDRIIAYLKSHPEGIDDSALTEALDLKRRQQANTRCRKLAEDGIIERRRVNGKIQNFWLNDGQKPTTPDLPSLLDSSTKIFDSRVWFWEGNVQAMVVKYLAKQGYSIRSVANTATRAPGKDIEAERSEKSLWITVKGFPEGTKKTQPSTQAGHWFSGAIFDLIKYRGESSTAELAIALPDFPRYRKLAEKISWFQSATKFSYFWVQENGEVVVE